MEKLLEIERNFLFLPFLFYSLKYLLKKLIFLSVVEFLDVTKVINASNAIKVDLRAFSV